MRNQWAYVWVGLALALYSSDPVTAQLQEPPRGRPPEAGATLVLPAPDPGLQAGLQTVLNQSPYRRLVQERRLSVALVDLSDPRSLRYAAVDDNRALAIINHPHAEIAGTVNHLLAQTRGPHVQSQPVLRHGLPPYK